MTGAIPKFSLDSDQFDQSTYLGRLYRCFNVVDPRTLLVTELPIVGAVNSIVMQETAFLLFYQKQLQDSLTLLKSFEAGSLPKDVTDKQLWHARKIKEAIIHPDTGDKIFMPFRMSGYVPFGTITVIGMLLPSPSFTQLIFWQWMNQSHNACVNYANRNATKETPTLRFIQSYVGAVSSAVGIAVGLSLAIKRSNLSLRSKALIQRFVAYPATCSANICNVFLMRQNELREGIDVQDENDNVVGTSKIAAWKSTINTRHFTTICTDLVGRGILKGGAVFAVKETALTRVVLPAPILIIPPFIMAFLERSKFLMKRPRLNMPINALVCTLSFGLALPFAIALFPQRSKIPTSRLEEELQAKTTEQILYFNKGL